MAQGDGFKILFPRTDLNVVVNGIPLEPEMGLSSWFAFMPLSRGTFMAGELVLLDQEVPKVTALAVENGLEVTALLNPLLGESPSIRVLRVQGRGSKTYLAQLAKTLLSATGTPFGTTPQGQGSLANPSNSATPLSTPQKQGMGEPLLTKIQAILGPGQAEEGILRYEIPRSEAVTEGGVEIPSYMGLETCFFLKKEGEKLLGAGKFILAGEELNPVEKTLSQSHITVAAVTNLLQRESPRLFLLCFWVCGDPKETAEGLKEALDLLQSGTGKGSQE
jgi:hypothetical protein